MSFPLAVVVLLRRADGRYLFVRRAPTRPAAGFWTPVSGRPLLGEALPDAARRELMEETGLRAGELVEVARGPAQGAPFELVYFACELDPRDEAVSSGGPAVKLLRDELDAHQWVNASELIALAPVFEATRRVLAACPL